MEENAWLERNRKKKEMEKKDERTEEGVRIESEGK
jgi:hypothetical protein